jgi:hypothetical protein
MYFFSQKINDKKPVKQAVNTLLGIGLFLADRYCKDLLRSNQLGFWARAPAFSLISKNNNFLQFCAL